MQSYLHEESSICLLSVPYIFELRYLSPSKSPPCSCHHNSLVCNCLSSLILSYLLRIGSWISNNHQCLTVVCSVCLIWAAGIRLGCCFEVDNFRNYGLTLLYSVIMFLSVVVILKVLMSSSNSIFRVPKFFCLIDHYSFSVMKVTVRYFSTGLMHWLR